jgi:hypothetical protein
MLMLSNGVHLSQRTASHVCKQIAINLFGFFGRTDFIAQASKLRTTVFKRIARRMPMFVQRIVDHNFQARCSLVRLPMHGERPSLSGPWQMIAVAIVWQALSRDWRIRTGDC